jgi:hypothetical protein
MDAARPTPPPALLVSSVLPLILREEHGERLEVDDKMMRIEENDYSQIICGTEETWQKWNGNPRSPKLPRRENGGPRNRYTINRTIK